MPKVENKEKIWQYFKTDGEMAERFKATVLKTVIRETGS